MVWLALIGLGIWLIVQQSSLGELKREVAQLRQRLAGAAPAPEPAPEPSGSGAWPPSGAGASGENPLGRTLARFAV